jgi:hypothetical protein
MLKYTDSPMVGGSGVRVTVSGTNMFMPLLSVEGHGPQFMPLAATPLHKQRPRSTQRITRILLQLCVRCGDVQLVVQTSQHKVVPVLAQDEPQAKINRVSSIQVPDATACACLDFLWTCHTHAVTGHWACFGS